MLTFLSLLFFGHATVLAPDISRQTPSVLVTSDTSHDLKLMGTARLPAARGDLVITTGDAAGGRLKLHGMRPASLFGGDFNTYVLWFVSADGRAHNAGEVQLHGHHAEMEVDVAISLDRFGVLITAEPHYLVDAPSAFVVLELVGNLSGITYRGFTGSYAYERDTLRDTKSAVAVVETTLPQALTAVRLLQRSRDQGCAHAERFEAVRSLKATLTLVARNSEHHEIESHARDTIRLAAAAQERAANCPVQSTDVPF